MAATPSRRTPIRGPAHAAAAVDVPVPAPSNAAKAAVHDEIPLSASVRAASVQWSPLASILPTPHVAEDGFLAEDIAQGNLGDCYFLSACAALCAHPRLLEDVLLTRTVAADGHYRVRFWEGGERWREVVVTDRFPVYTDRYYSRQDNAVYKGDGARRDSPVAGKFAVPVFGKPKRHGKAWMMILEKAYAAYHGGYGRIEKGTANNALLDLVPDTVAIDLTMHEVAVASAEKKKEAAAADAVGSHADNAGDALVNAAAAVWATLHDWLADGHLLAAVRSDPNRRDGDDDPKLLRRERSERAFGDAKLRREGSERAVGVAVSSGGGLVADPQGIIAAHCYSLLRCAESRSTKTRLVQLRNPWSEGEWTGPWSDGDTARWTPEVLRELGHELRDDGVFWMDVRDFVRVFDRVEMCRRFAVHPAAPVNPSAPPTARNGASPPEIRRGGHALAATTTVTVSESEATASQRWYKYVADGRWAGATAGGCAPSDTAALNPHYILHPTHRGTKAIISLLRTSGARDANVCMGFELMHADGARWTPWATTIVERYETQRNVAVEVDLPPSRGGAGDGVDGELAPLTLMVATFDPSIELAFRLTVYTTHPLALLPVLGGAVDADHRLRLLPDRTPPVPRSLPANWYRYTASGTWLPGKSAGGRNEDDRLITNPHFFVQPSRTCRMRIQLAQALRAHQPANTEPVHAGFELVRAQGSRVHAVHDKDSVLTVESYMSRPIVDASGTVDPDDATGAPLSLLVCTLDPDVERDFTIVVDTDAPLLDVDDGNRLRPIFEHQSPVLPKQTLRYRYIAQGRWAGPTAGGCPPSAGAVYNPQYLLQPTAATPAIVMLLRTSGPEDDSVCIGVQLLHSHGRRWTSWATDAVAAEETQFEYKRLLLQKVTLPTCDQPVTLLAATYEPGLEHTFVLAVDTDVPLAVVGSVDSTAAVAGPGGVPAGALQLQLLPDRAPPVPRTPPSWASHRYVASGTWQPGRTAGGRNTEKRVTNPHFLVRPSRPGQMRIQLLQVLRDHQPADTEDTYAGFVLVAADGARVRVVYKEDVILQVKEYDSCPVNEATGTVAPSANGTPLSLLVCTLDPDIQRDFTVVVDTEAPLLDTDGDRLRPLA